MTEQTTPQTPVSGARSHRKRVWFVVILVIVLGILIWRFAVGTSKAADNVVVLSGRIEGDDSAIAPKTSGRVAEVRFREGDSVKAGEAIAILDDAQVHAREDQARAALSASEARQQAAMSQLDALQAQLDQAEIQT